MEEEKRIISPVACIINTQAVRNWCVVSLPLFDIQVLSYTTCWLRLHSNTVSRLLSPVFVLFEHTVALHTEFVGDVICQVTDHIISFLKKKNIYWEK